jgi:thymidylate synthase (FAD)
MTAGHDLAVQAFTIPVLDHGYIKFIGSMGTDEDVIEAARMSTGRGFEGWESHERCLQCGRERSVHGAGISGEGGCFIEANRKWRKAGDANLLEFLYMNRHMTPFEMGELCIEVYAPIFVFREWHRHRTQSFNEFSARYAMMPNEHYIPDLTRIQKQSTTNKQGSAEVMDHAHAGQIIAEIERQQLELYDVYEAWVGSGVAKEIARINTPVSRYSKMRAKTDLRNWLAFLFLRMENSAQWEIRQYANALAGIIKKIWPRTFELFLEHDFFAVRFSRTEMRLLRQFLGGTVGAMEAEERSAMNAALSLIAINHGIKDKKLEALVAKFTKDKEADYPHLVKQPALELVDKIGSE